MLHYNLTLSCRRAVSRGGGMAMLELGYKASAEQFDARHLLDFAVLAEQQGFDSVFVSDHFQPWRHTGGHAPAAIAWLGRARRLDLAHRPRHQRAHPHLPPPPLHGGAGLRHARPAFSRARGAGRRLRRGSLNEVPATGAAWPELKERTARLREAVQLIRRLWSEERVSFEGAFYRTERATIYDRPEQPVPIYIAAAGPLVAKFAGRVGDGFICTSGKNPALYSETLLPNVAAGLAESGRPEAGFDRMIEMKVSFDTDMEKARQDTRLWAALALSPEEKMSVEDPLEMERLADALPVERAASRWIVSTDPDEHVEKIGAYIALGFRHLVFHAPGADQERFLRLYAAEVLPKLRAAFG